MRRRHTLLIKRLIKSPDPLYSLVGKFPLLKIEVTQTSGIICLDPPSPLLEGGKAIFKNVILLNFNFAALVSVPFVAIEHF